MPAKKKTAARRKTRTKARAKAKPKARPKKKVAKKAKASVGKAWTAADVKKLRMLYKAKPASAIAKTLRRSLASVRGKISALGLKKPASARKKVAKKKVAKRKVAKRKVTRKKVAKRKAAPKRKARAKAKGRKRR